MSLIIQIAFGILLSIFILSVIAKIWLNKEAIAEHVIWFLIYWVFAGVLMFCYFLYKPITLEDFWLGFGTAFVIYIGPYLGKWFVK